MVNVVIENGELHGKDRAVLRNEQLKASIINWEQRRDSLLDEIAFKKGQVEILEEIIKQAYHKMLDVNKEEQRKEEDLIEARMKELREEENLKVHKAKRKTSKGKPHPDSRAKELRRRKK